MSALDHRGVAIWLACLLAVAQPHQMARADPQTDAATTGSSANAPTQDAALLQQVKQLASQGQDAQTAAQVSKYVDQNQNIISAILKAYINYFKQLQTAPGDSNDRTPAATGTSATPSTSGASQEASSDQSAAPQNAATASAPATPQTSTAQRTSDLQPSSGLRTSHLAGYPSLPAVDPVTSITHPTAAQLEYAAKVQKEMQARKAYLMQHPEGYTY